MTQVDFYLLEATSRYNRLEFACKLAETIFKRGHQVLIHCASNQQAQELSHQLWAASPTSFLPHQLVNQPPAHPAAITLSWPAANHQPNQEVLLNLSLEVPENFSAYPRVTEIMNSDQEVLAAKREAWRFYNDRGYLLKLHKIN